MIQFLKYTTLDEYTERKWGNLSLPMSKSSWICSDPKGLQDSMISARRVRLNCYIPSFKLSHNVRELEFTRISRSSVPLNFPANLESLTIVGDTVGSKLPVSLKKLSIKYDSE